MRIEASSVETVRVAVAAREADTTEDPTAATVEIGATTSGLAPSTWVTGTWESAGPSLGEIDGEALDVWYATFLFGTGALDLGAGRYQAWIRIALGGETVVRRCGRLDVR